LTLINNMEDVDDLELDSEEIFNRAAAFVQKESTTGGTGKKPEQDVMLQIYGLYKSATIGKCTDPKPGNLQLVPSLLHFILSHHNGFERIRLNLIFFKGIFDPRGRAKWTAWVDASKLSKEEAMKGYIKLVCEHYNWDSAKLDDDAARNSSAFGGNAVSSFAIPQEEEEADQGSSEDGMIFRWIKENKLDQVAVWINQVSELDNLIFMQWIGVANCLPYFLFQSNNVNAQDKDGLSLLHWAVDRGHMDMAKLLLEKKADISVTDAEGLTPLDYAITCEHDTIVELLQRTTSEREKENKLLL